GWWDTPRLEALRGPTKAAPRPIKELLWPSTFPSFWSRSRHWCSASCGPSARCRPALARVVERRLVGADTAIRERERPRLDAQLVDDELAAFTLVARDHARDRFRSLVKP